MASQASGAARDEPAAGDVAAEAAVALDHGWDLGTVSGDVGVERGDVEHPHVLRQAGGDEVDVEPGEDPRRHLGPLLDQHLEPHAEAVGIELLVAAGVRLPPQIEVENLRDLAGRGQRQQRAAVLQAAAFDDAVQRHGRQPRHDLGDPRRVEELIEQRAAIATDQRGLAGALLHATSGDETTPEWPSTPESSRR